jgi:hypothetical protein
MTPDYDLSDLETSQAELWLCLQVEFIRAQILADQAKRQAATRSRQLPPGLRRREGRDRVFRWVRSSRLRGRSDLEALRGLPSQRLPS